MRIAVGCDHYGVEMKDQVAGLLRRLGHEVVDAGTHSADDEVDYPDIAAVVAGQVSRGEVQRGILIGAYGLGMCIVANKFRGVRAAPCHDDLSTEVSRRHNDLNVLCLSREVLGDRSVDSMVEIWLRTEFDGGRHARRLRKIEDLEGRQGG